MKQNYLTVALALLLALILILAGCGPDSHYYQGDGVKSSFTTRYRGIHMYNDVGLYVPEADIDKIGSWNVNLTRWAFIWSAMPDGVTVEQYRQFIKDQCDTLDIKLPAFERNGVKVCIVMGTCPGGRLSDGWRYRMFYPPYMDELQDLFVEAWEYIATRYKDNPTIVMYDLMNEPGADDLASGQPEQLFLRAAQAIRAIDADTEIVYEPKDNATYDNLQPFDLPGIIYSIHVYIPHTLTHQGLQSTSPVGAVYPGNIDNIYYTKNRLRDDYRFAKRFSINNKVRFYVGEFGCVHWAPNNSAYNYFKDCLDYFEEEGWDYTYFSLEPACTDNWGATAWSAEHDTLYRSTACAIGNTDRLELLRSYWNKNKK
jgi:hypothetical protein